MGQRANYILKEGDKLTIHYNHWRANRIASDLYLGEKKFLQFICDCQLNDWIMNEPWIEGCVVIDKPLGQLYFWTMEFSKEASVIDYYIAELEKKWKGWKIHFLKNRMYDVERILNIDYISKQELPSLYKCSKDEVINDKIEDWITAVVIIKQENDLFVTKTGNLDFEAVISYGEEIILLLKDKPGFELPHEGDEGTYECIVIDISEKSLFINKSSFGLWEQSRNLWNGYDFTMGDFGYIETLKLAGIDTPDSNMPFEKVIEQFNGIVKQVEQFDPFEMARKLTKENSDIQFNPDFFDNVKPRKTTLEKLKFGLSRMFRK